MKDMVLMVGLVGIWWILISALRFVASRLKVNEKVVVWIGTIIIFLICTYLWNFTSTYEWISEKTGAPLEK